MVHHNVLDVMLDHIQVKKGNTADSKCKSCEIGSYQNENGTSQCIGCNAGSYSMKKVIQLIRNVNLVR